MDLFAALHLDQLSHGLANLSMFPYFDMAHYIVSVMALREQPGALEVSRVSPLACWFSSMLFCFGGAVLSGIMLAEPPVAPLTNSTSVLLASVIWYLVFYCPMDLVYCCAALLPLRLVLSGMKEVTRTWKVLGGVTQAHSKYKDSLLVMIAIGWAKGAGGGLISNFEQLVRGVWKPETNELLRMSYPTKITLIGAVLFALQQTHYLPLQKHHLMLIYTMFTVVNKSRMMLTGSSASPFAAIESAIYKTLFTGSSPYAALTGECRDVRTREVGIQEIHHKVRPYQVELVRRDYVANGSWETFLSYEDPEQDILIGLLRLRRCSQQSFRPELKGGVSIVRELHVYGSVVPVSSRDPSKFQHQGFGMMLMEEAERIARDEHGSGKLAVISGVGTRNYYRKMGYELEGPYMVKDLYGAGMD